MPHSINRSISDFAALTSTTGDRWVLDLEGRPGAALDAKEMEALRLLRQYPQKGTTLGSCTLSQWLLPHLLPLLIGSIKFSTLFPATQQIRSQ